MFFIFACAHLQFIFVRQVAHVLVVIVVATVAAIGVIAYHIEGPTELLAKPHAFVKHGQLVHPIHIAPLPVHFNGRRT